MAERGLTGERRLATWKVVAAAGFIAAQVLIPIASGFASHQPATFGWHMFARGRTVVRFDVVRDDGRTDRLSSADILYVNRNDIDSRRLVPAALCGLPGVVEVIVRDPGRSERRPCD